MTSLRRPIATLVAIGHLLLSSLLVLPGTAYAQGPDGEPPTIEFERIDEGVRGETQVFSAVVTDEVGIATVALHFRLGTSDTYEMVPMEPLIGTDIFTASVDTTDTEETVLQYYIEARDGAGNRSIQGFAFDPIERVLVEDSASLAALPATGPVVERTSTGRKVLYAVLGVLAVGALAAAAGGGGSDGDTPLADDPGTAPLDIIVDPL